MNLETRKPAKEPKPLRRDEALTPEDAEIADLFRRVSPRKPLHELAVQRIRRGLEERARRTSSGGRRWIRTALAVAASLLLLETFAAFAVSAWPVSRRALVRAWQGPRRTLPALLPVTIPPVAPPAALPLASVASESTTPGIPVALAAPARAHRSPENHQLRRAIPSVAAVPQRPPKATIDDAEVTAYLAALAELNVHKDAARALTMLETYRSRYPAGMFQDEVTIAEVRAHVGLGHEREALALLDGLQARAFAGLPQAGELSLLRIELLGRAHRCAEALTLLIPELQSSQPPSLSSAQRERLLFERGVCDAELGNLQSGQQDLHDYLREFPHGRFEADLRQRIARAVPAPE